MVGNRVDEVKENVFNVESRLNSTWGGNLVDMVRSTQILEVIEEEKLVDNAATRGNYLKNRLYEIQSHFPSMISNTRGLGLLCSFDFPTTESRNKFRELTEKEKLLILGCGTKTIRFRPMLNIADDELEEGLQVIEKVLRIMTSIK